MIWRGSSEDASRPTPKLGSEECPRAPPLPSARRSTAPASAPPPLRTNRSISAALLMAASRSACLLRENKRSSLRNSWYAVRYSGTLQKRKYKQVNYNKILILKEDEKRVRGGK